MRISIYYLLPLFCILLFSTCKKDREEDCPCDYEQGFQQVKDWMYFETGSYWIYEEENSGAIDTITVYEHWQGQDPEGNNAFISNTISSHDGYLYLYDYNSSFTIHCLNTPSCQCEKVERSKGRPGEFVGSEKNFFFPAIPGNYSAAGSDVSLVEEVMENHPVLGDSIFFSSVFYIEDDLSEAHEQTRFIIAKNVGIIRKEIVGLELIWNLIEYDIIQ